MWSTISTALMCFGWDEQDLFALEHAGDVEKDAGMFLEARARYLLVAKLVPSTSTRFAIAMGNLATVAYVTNDLEQAESFTIAHLGAFSRLGRRDGMISAYSMLANIAARRRDYELAAELPTTCEQMNIEVGSVSGTISLTIANGVDWLTRGDVDEASNLFDKAQDLCEQSGKRVSYAILLGQIVRWWLGFVPESAKHARQLFERGP